MVITILADVLGVENNGTTIASMNLINYLKDQGHEVRIVCCDQNKKGLPGYYVVKNRNLGFLINYILKLNEVVLAYADKKILKEALTGADLVHAMIPFALSCHGTRMAKKMGIPVTAGFHAQAENFSSHIFMLRSRLVNHLTYLFFRHRVYKYVDAIHCPSEFIKDEFIAHCPNMKNKKYYVISNGVNDRYVKKDVEKLNDGKFNILFIGRLSKEKSHELLIKGVSKSKYEKNIQIYLAGAGPRYKPIVRLAKRKLTNQPIIKFYSRDELVDIINKMDLYVHASYAEIEAISCLEAIKCGLVPVINNSNKSATKMFARNEYNLFKKNSAKSLANRIDFWIENPELKEKEIENYQIFSKDFDQKECMLRMEKMMVEVVNNYKHEK